VVQTGPTVTGCDVNRNDVGAFILTVTATNAPVGSVLTLDGGVSPKKVKTQVSTGTPALTTFTAKGGFCSHLPGPIVVTNPQGVASQQFQCNKTCATQ
jgi:hypothetical protein